MKRLYLRTLLALLATAPIGAEVFAQTPVSSAGLKPRNRPFPVTGAGSATAAATTAPAPAAPTPATPAAPATPKTVPVASTNGKAQADTSGLAQFEQGVEYEPRGPNYRVSFSLEDADLPELVRVIGQLTGKRFIFGGKVRSIKATVFSPQKVTVAEAYQAFLSILETNGLTVVPHGRFLKIVETTGIASQATPMYSAGQAAPAEERYITRIHRLSHVSADDAAVVLTKFKSKEGAVDVYGPGNLLILTDTGVNIRRMMQLLEDIDVGGSGDQVFIEPVHYASATEIANRINELFDVKPGAAPAAGAKGAPGAAGGASAGGSGGELHVAKIVPDDRTNSIVIVSTERAYLRILELVKRIDVPQTGEGEIHVLPLQHADAVDLVKTLNEIVTGASAAGAAPGGRGAPAQQAAASPPSGVFEGGVKVSADKATNAIVITSSLRDFASLRAVIDRLDQPRRQVFIEAVIMDLQLNRSDIVGNSFHAGSPFDASLGDTSGQGLVYGGNKIMNTILPVPTDPDALQGFALGVKGPGITGNFLGTGLSIPAFGAFIQAVARTGDSDLLSTPHILALDNEDAEISVGDNVPLQQNAVPNTFGALGALGGAAGGAGAAAGLGALGGMGGFSGVGARQDVGTKIKIKPHLNDSDEVRLDVLEEISEQGAPVGNTAQIQISKRTATTKMVVKDQQTVVIGGLVRNVASRAEEKVPVLGDIPVLGALFRKRTNSTQKRNLVLVMTPYIIRSQSDLRTVFERKMQERQEYLDRYFVFSDNGDYQAPKDYSRTNGVVEDIRQAYFFVEEKRRLEEIAKPRELRTHTPQSPLEMPGNPRSLTGGAAGGAAGGGAAAQSPAQPAAATNPANPASPAAPPVNVSPPARNLDRVEKVEK